PTISILSPYTTLFRSIADVPQVADCGGTLPNFGRADGFLAGADGTQPIVVMIIRIDDAASILAQRLFQDGFGLARNAAPVDDDEDRKSTRLNSSHLGI